MTCKSPCPTFIVAVAGPWMVVLGSLFTTKILVQRLTEYVWLGGGRIIDDQSVIKVARLFAGLRVAVTALANYYRSLPAVPYTQSCGDTRSNLLQRSFPLANSCVVNGEKITWKYEAIFKKTDHSYNTFLASSTEKEQKLIIKFVERYGESAHRKLDGLNHAPRLLYCGDIWSGDTILSRGCSPRKMVVMEYIEGKTLDEMYTSGQPIPEAVHAAVETIVMILHEDGLVHGDIRRPNIMIKDGTGGMETRVQLLDFDWSGAEKEVRYPLNLSKMVFPSDADDYAPISKEHDLAMIKRL